MSKILLALSFCLFFVSAAFAGFTYYLNNSEIYFSENYEDEEFWLKPENELLEKISYGEKVNGIISRYTLDEKGDMYITINQIIDEDSEGYVPQSSENYSKPSTVSTALDVYLPNKIVNNSILIANNSLSYFILQYATFKRINNTVIGVNMPLYEMYDSSLNYKIIKNKTVLDYLKIGNYISLEVNEDYKNDSEKYVKEIILFSSPEVNNLYKKSFQ